MWAIAFWFIKSTVSGSNIFFVILTNFPVVLIVSSVQKALSLLACNGLRACVLDLQTIKFTYKYKRSENEPYYFIGHANGYFEEELSVKKSNATVWSSRPYYSTCLEIIKRLVRINCAQLQF